MGCAFGSRSCVGGGARTDEGAKEEAEREEGRPSIS